ncbi:MAG: hypothetical protein HY508_13790 [Acidobacteria bacterium]|nr:hypothetical protein [Acidobacteriota bacterium]
MNLPTLKKKYLWVAIPALLLAVGGLAISTATRGQTVAVPAGTEIQVRLNESIATNRDTAGDSFQAVVAEPVMIDGKTVIPKGAPASGQIVSIRESGRLSGVARMRLMLKSVEVDGKEYELHTSDYSGHGGNHRKRNWGFIGGGAGGGALIGALAAGGKGAAIGGPIGAGAGIAAATLTGKKDFVLPAETLLRFELADPVEVKLKS